MKFKRALQNQLTLDRIVLLPLVNVVLLLLIFFVLTSALTVPPTIDVRLPKAVTSDILRDQDIIISVTGEDVIYFNNQVVTIKELRILLNRSIGSHAPVLIKADRRANMGRIVDIWDLCRKAGIEKINIATSREK